MVLHSASASSHGRSVLELLAAEGQPVSRSEIKRHLGLAESHLSHLLRDLEQANLITRSRGGKGREVFVDLGPEGRRVAKSALLPRWVERLAGLIAEAQAGAVPARDVIAGELVAAGAPSRAAADRLAQALAELSQAPAAQLQRSRAEVRESSLFETNEAWRMDFAGPAIEPWLQAAAAARGQGVRDYVVEALRERLAADGFLPGARPATSGEAARWLDGLRRQVGPVGIPVRELVREGRRR